MYYCFEQHGAKVLLIDNIFTGIDNTVMQFLLSKTTTSRPHAAVTHDLVIVKVGYCYS